ncbi:MAG TPA: methyltransferase domain-containing protein [Burkholderiaceae bacterium]|nr:methyltransferase domain-containing protein [Burkholderiaceae bacterium]
MSRFIRSSTALALVGVLAAATFSAEAKDRRECDRDYKPQVGQSGKDVVWVPTPDEVVQRMLRMAKVTPQDIVYDLGAGDGKIAIAAGKLGATSVGIEYNPEMAKLAQCYVQAEELTGKTRIIQGDVFKEDFSKASVVTMYLLPELNLRLRPTILNMKPGTRVTSHQFTMGDWEPDETAEIDYRTAYLWIVPAKVEGTWSLREQGSNAQYAVNLSQKYQKITGDIATGSAKQPLVGATVRGEEIRFAFNDDKGVTRTLNGTVRGNELTGTLKSANGTETKVTGTRK